MSNLTETDKVNIRAQVERLNGYKRRELNFIRNRLACVFGGPRSFDIPANQFYTDDDPKTQEENTLTQIDDLRARIAGGEA